MRILLDHPSADPAAMMAVRSTAGISVFVAAAGCAAGVPTFGTSTRSCAPLLLLLRRGVESQSCESTQQAHVSEVMEALCKGPRSKELFDDDTPDDDRDECVRLLLEMGANSFDARRPVFSRIIRELAQMARVPQLINDAVVGMAFAKQQQGP
jgi:hypothetical protein